MGALYDHIGQVYNGTRQADPFLLARLIALLDLAADAQCLDVACGTGNYTRALAAHGGHWTACDISTQMLNVAAQTESAVHWQQADVLALPFADRQFTAAMTTLAIHHFPDLTAAFTEVRRVLCAGGRYVLLTAFTEQMQHYWLNRYFPIMMAKSSAQMPTKVATLAALDAAGFDVLAIEPYSVQPDLQDAFLYSGKYDPQRYFDPLIRANISSFANLIDADELAAGLALLRSHIDSGQIHHYIQAAEHPDGDYAFLQLQARA
nr:methyltransferase domain-containing protein [uncultured Deefgea sp.]